MALVLFAASAGVLVGSDYGHRGSEVPLRQSWLSKSAAGRFLASDRSLRCIYPRPGTLLPAGWAESGWQHPLLDKSLGNSVLDRQHCSSRYLLRHRGQNVRCASDPAENALWTASCSNADCQRLRGNGCLRSKIENIPVSISGQCN